MPRYQSCHLMQGLFHLLKPFSHWIGQTFFNCDTPCDPKPFGMLAFGSFFFLSGKVINFIWVLCIGMSFHVKNTGGYPRRLLLQQCDTRRETLSFGTQVGVNVRIILATPNNQQHSPTRQWMSVAASTPNWRLHGWHEHAERQMHFFPAGCWELTWFSDMQEQYHKSSFLTSGSSASVASLCYP